MTNLNAHLVFIFFVADSSLQVPLNWPFLFVVFIWPLKIYSIGVGPYWIKLVCTQIPQVQQNVDILHVVHIGFCPSVPKCLPKSMFSRYACMTYVKPPSMACTLILCNPRVWFFSWEKCLSIIYHYFLVDYHR